MREGEAPDARDLLEEARASGCQLFVSGGQVCCRPKPSGALREKILANRDVLYLALLSQEAPPEGPNYLGELRRLAPNLWRLVKLDDGRVGILWGVHARGVIVWTAPDKPLLALNPSVVTVMEA